ncbi:hypothetical protein NKH77_27515 [Streptomyces sp. M19]
MGRRAGRPPVEEFWPRIIEDVRRARPGLTFIAEAYWDLEWALQRQGFDFAYDKRLYDRLLHDPADSVRAHLRAAPEYQRGLVRFLENHDEPRAATPSARPGSACAPQRRHPAGRDAVARGPVRRAPRPAPGLPDPPPGRARRPAAARLLRAAADRRARQRHAHRELAAAGVRRPPRQPHPPPADRLVLDRRGGPVPDRRQPRRPPRPGGPAPAVARTRRAALGVARAAGRPVPPAGRGRAGGPGLRVELPGWGRTCSRWNRGPECREARARTGSAERPGIGEAAEAAGNRGHGEHGEHSVAEIRLPGPPHAERSPTMTDERSSPGAPWPS